MQRLLTVLGFVCCAFIFSALERVASSEQRPTAPAQMQTDITRLRDQGKEALDRKQYLQAEQLFLAGLAKARTAHFELVAVYILNDLGNLKSEQEQYEAAADYHAQALALLEKRHSADPKEIKNLALADAELGRDLCELAHSHRNNQKYESAVFHLNRALVIYERQKDYNFIPAILLNLDIAYQVLGRYDKSLNYHHHALTLRKQMGNESNIAVSLENLGDVHFTLTRNDEALKYYSDAFDVWKKVGDKGGNARCLSGMGRVYLVLFQFQKAQEAFTQALAHFSTSQTSDIALCHLGRGGAFRGLGKFKEAQSDYTQALVLYQQVHDAEHVELCRISLAAMQSFVNGKMNSVDVLHVVNSQPMFHNELSIALNLLSQGSLQFLHGHTRTAISLLERTLPMLQRLHAFPFLTPCWSMLAEAYERQSRLDKAQTAYQHAVDSYEAFSEQVGDPGQLGLLQASGANLYAHYARLLVQQKQTARALLIVERGRAQGLARQAAQNQVEFNASILSRVEAVEVRRRNEALRSAAWDYFVRHLPGAQARYEQAKQRRDLLNTALYKRHAAYKRLRGAEPPTFARLQILAQQHPDTLYLEWAVVDEQTSLLFALSHSHGLQAFPLPYGSKSLFDLIHQWRVSLNATAQLNDRHTSFDKQGALLKVQEAEPQAAAKLYTLLFSPLERADLLSNARRLVLVADGPLLNAPFAALQDTHGKRLIERYALSSVISLRTLLWPPNPRQAEKMLFSLADPTGDTRQKPSAATAGATSGNFPTYGPLPFARDYATAIAASVPGTRLYVGQKAQKAVILPQLSHHAVLLFATHGALNANNGLRSALILASAESGKWDYDTLEAREIAGLQLSARLAILAACESGLGQESGGEGLLGLAWAFRAAGCPCVTASQWSVDEEATSLLMKHFSDGLKAHKCKDDALRQAMLQVQHDPAHPDYARAFYWAAFQVIGDPAPISFGNAPTRH